MKISDFLTEVHYIDMTAKNFEVFRRNYLKLAKTQSIRGLYVQFTSFNNNTMDRTSFINPDHSDFVGTYGFPLKYVLSHPADIWYGNGTRYLRVLEDHSKKKLYLESIRSLDAAARILVNMGMSIVNADRSLELAAKYFKSRNTGKNKFAKMFMTAMQMDLLSPPMDNGKSSMSKTPEFRLRTGLEQTQMLLKAGYDAVEDMSTNSNAAIINGREPEQIVFLTRAAFRVREVYSLRPGVPERKLPVMTYADPSAEVIERPFAQSLASMMDDKLKDGPERTSLGGWSYYWTVKGRRIEIEFSKPSGYYDNKKIGEKKHKEAKLFDTHRTNVKIHTEIGDITGRFHPNVKFKEIVRDLLLQWHELQQNPQETEWQPESKALFYDKEKAAQSAQIDAKLKKERDERLERLPEFLSDIEWIANYYHLPFKPNENYEDNEYLMKALSSYLNAVTEEENSFVKEYVLDGNKKILRPQWDQMFSIIKKAFEDINFDKSWFGDEYMFTHIKQHLQKKTT